MATAGTAQPQCYYHGHNQCQGHDNQYNRPTGRLHTASDPIFFICYLPGTKRPITRMAPSDVG